jgi:hypothetical protein
MGIRCTKHKGGFGSMSSVFHGNGRQDRKETSRVPVPYQRMINESMKYHR